MNFSDLLRVTSSHLSWSPNRKYCAVGVNARIEVRAASTLQLQITFNCGDVVQILEWSPDSSLVMTGNYKRNFVEVWRLEDPEWRCKIDEGSAGLLKVVWSPDSRHLITTAEFYLRLTVWSLVNKSVSYIKYPKEASPGMQFSPDSEYLAVAERKDCKDFISLFETKSWQLVKHFEVGTTDLAGLKWANDNSVIAVWESPLDYRVLVYTITGECLATYTAYQWALGIKNVVWSPSSQFLVIGSYDQKVRVLNHITWKVVTEFSHDSNLENKDCVVYKEVEKQLTGYPATLVSVQGLRPIAEIIYEEEETRPITLATIPLEATKQAHPKVGIGLMLFSCDGRYLATRNDNMPATVWVWSIPKLSLVAVIVHSSPIKEMVWSPVQCQLAICNGSNHIYIWSPFGCLTVPVPDAPALQVSSLKWHPSGTQLAVLSRDQFSVCYFGSSTSHHDDSKLPFDEELNDDT